QSHHWLAIRLHPVVRRRPVHPPAQTVAASSSTSVRPDRLSGRYRARELYVGGRIAAPHMTSRVLTSGSTQHGAGSGTAAPVSATVLPDQVLVFETPNSDATSLASVDRTLLMNPELTAPQPQCVSSPVTPSP